ncbi:profilin [Polychytrium aggregatum]|uniref:profilin n=1 Tax=Polychytrium aggregatum TaxID=110093 RepID=UPI0022FECE7F|nr:profilin [Polychytrium aggregatum]KAI9206988.1 profilin [Polychytrium aggregatum]
MSWQTYVDTNMVGTGKISRGAIHGHDGSVWATSPGFSVHLNEVKAILKAYQDPSEVRANGLLVNDVKYIVLRVVDDRSLYAKKGNSGIVAVKTKQAILIGVYDEPIQPGEANKVVESLGDYLISVSY